MRMVNLPSELIGLVQQERAARRMTERDLLIRAGLSPSLLSNRRAYPRRSINLTTAAALLNALGYDLVALERKD